MKQPLETLAIPSCSYKTSWVGRISTKKKGVHLQNAMPVNIFWLKFHAQVCVFKFACLSTFAPSVLFFNMATPTVNLSNPWGKMAENKKARTRYGTESPFTPLLQEEKDKQYERMADEEEELVRTCPPPVESPKEKIHPRNVTMDGIAALLKQQFGPITANINALSAGVQMLDAKVWRFDDCRGKSPEGNGVAHGCYPSSGGKNGRTSATFK